MVRTQVYLTEDERAGLEDISRLTGKKQSELIREAVDMFLDASGKVYREMVLKEAAGMWKNRNDLPCFERVRLSWNREER